MITPFVTMAFPCDSGQPPREVSILFEVRLFIYVILAFLCLWTTGCTAPNMTDASVVSPSDIDRSFAEPTEQPWVFKGVDGTLIRTNHYRIHTTLNDDALLDSLPRFLEAALLHYRSSIVNLPEPKGRLDTFIFDQRSQWEAFTIDFMGNRAKQYLQIGRGGYATGGRAVFYDIGVYDTLSIAAHEGWHQFVQRSFNDVLPIWADEGLATFMEGHEFRRDKAYFHPWMNTTRHDELRRALRRDQLFSLADLLDIDPADLLGNTTQQSDTNRRGRQSKPILIYYAQVWALLHFLNSSENGKYQERLQLLINDAQSGRMNARVLVSLRKRGIPTSSDSSLLRVGPDVFMTYFSADLHGVGEAYLAFIAEICSPHARAAIRDGHSPLD